MLSRGDNLAALSYTDAVGDEVLVLKREGQNG
jgi:hypothetical protein